MASDNKNRESLFKNKGKDSEVFIYLIDGVSTFLTLLITFSQFMSFYVIKFVSRTLFFQKQLQRF